jgi:hypothetical protein
MALLNDKDLPLNGGNGAAARRHQRAVTDIPGKGGQRTSISADEWLNELDVIAHVLGLKDFPEEGKGTNDIPDGAALLVAVGNPCVLGLAVVKGQEVLVVGVHHAALRKGKGKVGVVLGTEQPRIRRGRYVDAAAAKAGGDGIRRVLVKMEA